MKESELEQLETFLEIVGKGKLEYEIDEDKSVKENKQDILKLVNKKGYSVKIEAVVKEGGKIKKKATTTPKKPFPNLTKREYEHILESVPDSHNLDDADKKNDYPGLCQYMLDEWGVTVPDMPPKNKKELKERQRQAKEETERLQLEQERKKIEGMIEQENELGEKIIKNNKVTDKIMMASRQDIRDEITRYNPHCEAITWNTIFCFMGGKRYNIMNLGAGGLGKSRGNFNLVKQKGKEFCPFLNTFGNVVTISGHITPKRFFQYLKMDSILIIDESYSILKNNLIQHLLRGALYDGFVIWNSTKDEGDNEHDFKGSVIFNTNQLGNSLNDKALMDRTFCNNLKIDKEQIKDKIRQRRTYVPNKNVWELIKNRLIAIRTGKINIKLSEVEKDLVYDFSIRKIEEIEDKGDFSVRAVERTERLFLSIKTFFGFLDKDLIDFAKKLSSNYFVVEHNQEVTERKRMEMAKKEILTLIPKKKSIKSSVILHAVIKKGICGKDTYYELTRELERENVIKQKGVRNKTISLFCNSVIR